MPSQRLGLFFLIAIVMISWKSESRSYAQFERFDKGRLIETMRDRRMNQLLIHFAENSGLDAVDATAIQVSIHRALGDNPRLPVDQRKEEYKQALVLLKELIDDKKLRNFPKRPMWQAEYAEISFYKVFFLKATHLFYEFGLPDKEQRAEFQKYVLNSYLMLNEAELQIFKLRTALPGREDYLEKYQSTGLADRILNEYGEMRIPFMNAIAHYYMSLFPQGHEYFKKKYPLQVPRKMGTAKGEKDRLLKSAIAKLDTILESPDTTEQLKTMANTIKGRAYMGLKKIPAGQSILSEAAQASEMGGLSRLEAQLGIVYGLGVYSTRTQPAIRILHPLYDYPLVRPSQPFQILLADLENKVLMKTAGKDPKKIAAAFKPYEKLIKSDPGIGSFLNERWAEQVKNPADILKLPPMAALGVGELKLGRAQQDGDAAAMAEAEKIFANVYKHKSASRLIKAKALHRQALSIYFVNQNELNRIKKAVALMIRVGEEFPEEKSVAQKAISEGVNMLPNILESNKDPQVRKEIGQLFAKGMKVVMAKFPQSKVAKQQRIYYAEKFLFNKGKFQECADVLADLTEGEDQYFAGMRLILESKVGLLKEAANSGNTSERNALQAEVALLVNDIKMKAKGNNSETAQYLLGSAILTNAEMSMRLEQYLVAITALKNFESEVNVTSFPDLLARAVRIRVTSAGYLGKSQEAGKFLTQLDSQFPDQSGGVMHNMLGDFMKEIEELDALVNQLGVNSSSGMRARDKIKSLAGVGSVVCQNLLQWVRQRKAQFPNSAGMILGYQLTLAKLNIQANQAAAAIKIVEEARKVHVNDPNVIFHYAEVFYFAGKADKVKQADYLKKAKKEFGFLAKRLDPEFEPTVSGTPLERIWWNSWLRFMQIMLLENKDKERIPGLIKRLSGQDPEMGGFKKMFKDVEKRS